MIPLIRSPQLRAPARPRGATRLAAPVRKKTRVLPWRTWLRWSLNSVLLTGLVVGSFYGYDEVKPWLDRPIREVALTGDLQHIDGAALSQSLQQEVNGTFFDVDLAPIRKVVESDPWVDHVDIHRSWPDKIVVHVEESLPVARWDDGSLVDSVGRVFTPAQAQLQDFASLPQLRGPADQVPEVMRYFSSLSQQLKPLGFSIHQLVLENRGAWTADLIDADGQPLKLILGREDLKERLARFSKIYEIALKSRIDKIEQVDARHANGVAVRWKSDEGKAKG